MRPSEAVNRSTPTAIIHRDELLRSVVWKVTVDLFDHDDIWLGERVVAWGTVSAGGLVSWDEAGAIARGLAACVVESV